MVRPWLCLLCFVLALFAGGLVSPAGADRPIPAPEDSVVHPNGMVSVQDLPPVAPASPDPKHKERRVENMDVLNGTKLAHGGALAHQPPPSSGTPAPITVAGVVAPGGLQGLRLSESGGWIPPDTQIGVGPGHVFEVVNLEGRIWTKTGSLVKSFDLNSFFGLPPSVELSDPRIRFDALSNRWFVAIVSFNSSFTSGAWNLAVSSGPDPTATFVRYTISTSKSAPDFPALAINEDKVVLTANAFRGNSFVGTEFVVLNKANLVAWASVASSYFGPPQGLFTIQPAHALSTNCVGNCPLYMASVAFNSASSIQVWTVTGVPGSGSVTRTTTTKSIGTLTSPPDAKQQGTTVLIQTNDNRLLDAAYRDNILWVAATSACVPTGDSSTRACLRFIKLSTASGISKVQDFDFGQLAVYYYYPALQIDAGKNLIAVFSGSSTSNFASVYASGQGSTDPVNTFQLPVLVKQGENAYKPFASRWGDYSSAALDPSDQSTVWVAGEYAHIDGGSEWGTWIAPVHMFP